MKTSNRPVLLVLVAALAAFHLCGSEREAGFEKNVNENVVPHSLISGVCIDEQKGVLHLDCAQQLIDQTIGNSTKGREPAIKGSKEEAASFNVSHLLRWKERE